MIKLYNSLTRKKETFKPITEGKVRIYSCGPTVYNYVHIGNLRSYILMDILVRTLKFFGYKVTNVMNITDVDDKTIRDSKSKKSGYPNKKLNEFTRFYEKEFFKDLELMNITKPIYTPRATETIYEMEKLINKLYKKGYAYITEDGIYFDISKDKKYGQLIKLDKDKLKYNRENRVVVDEYTKDDVRDFALWKFKKNNEPFWEIEVNEKKYEGRPGWHIECSAMSMKYLGEHFDIHTGGIDLKFPHHENEIAQSECATGIKFVNYWLHNEHLLVDGKKMSKSFGNFYTLKDIIEKGYSTLSLRYLLLSVHYRQQLNFTFEALKSAENTVKKINDFYILINSIIPKEGNEKIKEDYIFYLEEFKKGLEDDLNTPISLSAFFEFMNYVNRNLSVLTHPDIKLVKEFITIFNEIFGVIVEEKIPKEIEELAKKRKEYKKQGLYEEADKIRELISKKGYEIKDYKFLKKGYLILLKKY